MTDYFTSDLHLGHERIIDLCNRPFKSVEHMNNQICGRWNEQVTEDDQVFILGDLAMGPIKESLKLVEKLKGKKYLVPGNHDRVHPCYPQKAAKGEEMCRMYEDAGLAILGLEVDYYPLGSALEQNPLPWKLCHFPTSGDHTTDDRYPEYRPSLDDNEWLIHGHVHELWAINGRQINVGVDQWDFTPVRESVLRAIIENEDRFSKLSQEEIRSLFSAP